jgi:hypothetical protein
MADPIRHDVLVARSTAQDTLRLIHTIAHLVDGESAISVATALAALLVGVAEEFDSPADKLLEQVEDAIDSGAIELPELNLDLRRINH